MISRLGAKVCLVTAPQAMPLMSKIADLTYQGIRDRIISGEYSADTHLKEARLADTRNKRDR
jgi:DNA-binding GntR family transcriptional regulator